MVPVAGGLVGAEGGVFGAVVPMEPEEGADIPVPGAVIAAPPEAGAMALPEAGAIALPGGALIAPDDAGVDEVELEEAGATPALAFCRLCSFSFAVSASPDIAPFFIMPCLPCILWWWCMAASSVAAIAGTARPTAAAQIVAFSIDLMCSSFSAC